MLLWANGPIDPALADGCVYFHQHDFNVGQHVAHNEMLDECVRRGYFWHIRADDDCFMKTKRWLARLLNLQEKVKILRQKYAVFSPTITGLNDPPPSVRSYEIGSEIFDHVAVLGGIFRLAPMSIMRYFRWDERQAMGFGDATQFKSFCDSTDTHMLRAKSVRAAHGESTMRQEADADWAYEHDMLQYIPLGL